MLQLKEVQIDSWSGAGALLSPCRQRFKTAPKVFRVFPRRWLFDANTTSSDVHESFKVNKELKILIFRGHLHDRVAAVGATDRVVTSNVFEQVAEGSYVHFTSNVQLT